MDILKGRKLVLGSKSPRRSQLLSEAGLPFCIRVQDCNEDFDPSIPVLEVPGLLAARKAEALLFSLTAEEILLTADSVVISEGKIYNKPADFDEGIQILQALSGKTHTVATGVCLTGLHHKQFFTVTTEITFDTITEAEMGYYLTTHHPYDKAGSYGIQDWIGLCKVKRIEGSYSNVMGLPIREVYQALHEFTML
jgi:septum formation protein